jgi:hypothetical protein
MGVLFAFVFVAVTMTWSSESRLRGPTLVTPLFDEVGWKRHFVTLAFIDIYRANI